MFQDPAVDLKSFFIWLYQIKSCKADVAAVAIILHVSVRKVRQFRLFVKDKSFSQNRFKD